MNLKKEELALLAFQRFSWEQGMPDFAHEGQSPEAQAFWLMMEHEAERWKS